MSTTMPRERPILFSEEMSAAVWDERKWQTRRMIGLAHLRRSETPGYHWTWRGQAPVRSIAQQRRHPRGCWQDMRHADFVKLCPYGQPGDRLWVRESFLPCKGSGFPCRPADASYVCFSDGAQQFRSGAYHSWPLTTEPNWSKHRFSPSIHMPRWAARSLLEITEVRAELLLSISHGDAIAEGIASVPQLGVLRASGWRDYSGQTPGFLSPVDSFRSLWQKINGADAWRADQWVWVISFRKVIAV